MCHSLVSDCSWLASHSSWERMGVLARATTPHRRLLPLFCPVCVWGTSHTGPLVPRACGLAPRCTPPLLAGDRPPHSHDGLRFIVQSERQGSPPWRGLCFLNLPCHSVKWIHFTFFINLSQSGTFWLRYCVLVLVCLQWRRLGVLSLSPLPWAMSCPGTHSLLSSEGANVSPNGLAWSLPGMGGFSPQWTLVFGVTRLHAWIPKKAYMYLRDVERGPC